MNQPCLYSEYSSMQRRDSAEVLRKKLSKVRINSRDRILDVGAGDGKTTIELLLPQLPEHFEKLVGTDVSNRMVEYAKKNCDVPKVDFVVMDVGAGHLDVEFEEQFDHVFSFYCLHWVEPRVAFKNIFDMLKPGGDILVTFLATHPIYEIFERTHQNIRWAKYGKTLPIPPYHKCLNHKKYMEDILTEIGYINFECNVENKTYNFDNFDVIEKSIAAVDPIRPNIPQDELKKYNQDLFDQMRAVNNVKFDRNDSNGEENVTVDYKLYVIYARKPVYVVK